MKVNPVFPLVFAPFERRKLNGCYQQPNTCNPIALTIRLLPLRTGLPSMGVGLGYAKLRKDFAF